MAKAGIFLFFMSFISLFPVSVRAAETQPGDACPTAGLIRDTGGPEQIPGMVLICNGTVWKMLEERATDGKSLFQVNSDSGACDSDKQGRLRYTSASDTWEYCSGSTWSPFEQAGLVGPAGCANIGDLCADGTVYAGYHPITQEHLFIPTTDQGTTSTWKTSTGTNDIATDSIYDGRINTDQVANSTTFPAFKLCKDLGTGGHADWYLPSQVETYYLWSVRDIIQAGGNITNFQSALYWASTEATTTTAWSQQLGGGQHNTSSKNSFFRVRCVRR
ncbi:DUF1566 domain-containing protein [Pseudomonas sp. G5(2012)]|uniref:Lcl domain-containing protein n=1 Tax=Pseudomonas sp. G5(2012) TaxID=1268068 RepID=UPI0015A56B86|nr:DUF1566 domain-containing protein [Pseudomonas sp. G5(2012)]